LNLVTDSFPALALGMEPGEPHLMRAKPRGHKEPILTRYHYGIIAVQSIAITAATLIGFVIGLNRVGLHGTKGYVFKMGLFSNRFLAYSTLIGIALMLVTVYVPKRSTHIDRICLHHCVGSGTFYKYLKRGWQCFCQPLFCLVRAHFLRI